MEIAVNAIDSWRHEKVQPAGHCSAQVSIKGDYYSRRGVRGYERLGIVPDLVGREQILGEHKMLKRLIGIFIIVLASATLSAQPPQVRVSAWYWLNAAPKVDWQGDFVTMKN